MFKDSTTRRRTCGLFGLGLLSFGGAAFGAAFSFFSLAGFAVAPAAEAGLSLAFSAAFSAPGLSGTVLLSAVLLIATRSGAAAGAVNSFRNAALIRCSPARSGAAIAQICGCSRSAFTSNV